MHDIYNYTSIPETNHVPKIYLYNYSVFTIYGTCNIIPYIKRFVVTAALAELSAVLNMAVFCCYLILCLLLF